MTMLRCPGGLSLAENPSSAAQEDCRGAFRGIQMVEASLVHFRHWKTEVCMAMVFAYAGAILVSLFALPQLREAIVSRNTEGVSALSWAMQAACAATFLVYGIGTVSHPQIVGNLLPVVCAALMVAVILSNRRKVRRATMVIVGVLAVGFFAVELFVVPPLAVGYSAVLLAVVCRWPQVVSSWNSLRNRSVTSVAKLTWVLSIVAMASWMGYGVIESDLPVIAACLVSLVASVLILSFELLNARLPIFSDSQVLAELR